MHYNKDYFQGNTEETNEINILSKKYKVFPYIHSQDHIFNFLYNNPVFNPKLYAIRYYFNDGYNSVVELNEIINKYKFKDKINLLEFACGYGCLTRHFKNVFEEIEVISSDIHPEANKFIQENLGYRTIQSVTNPDNYQTNQKFDFIFALSFFSHMPKSTWINWFETLATKICSKGGFLIFTTQGIESQKFFPNSSFDQSGYWFSSGSEQTDLDNNDYGNTIVSFDFVYNVIKRYSNLELVEYIQGKWWNHQDLFIVKNAK